MKKIVSFLLVLAMIVTSMLGFSSCAFGELTLTMGQWLALVADAFGMTTYTQQEPYFDKVNSESAYFDAFQMAAEWEILIPSSSVSADQTLTWRDALITLVNACGLFEGEKTDDEKIDYAIENFDDSIRKYRLSGNIPQENAVALLSKAQEFWAGYHYEENTEKYNYNENVKDLSCLENVEIRNEGAEIVIPNLSQSNSQGESGSNGSEINSDNENNAVQGEGGIAAIPAEIKEGDICIVNAGGELSEKEYKKVEGVERNNGNIVIHTSEEEVKLEDVYKDLFIEETLVPNADNTLIYDPDGNLIGGNPKLISQLNKGGASMMNMGYDLRNPEKHNDCADIKSGIKWQFNVGNLKITLNGEDKNGKINLTIEADSPNILSGGKGNDNHGELNFKGKVGVENLALTSKFDFGWFELKSALLKLDYDIVGELKLDYSNNFKAVAAPELSNRNGKFLTNAKNAIFKSENGAGAKTIASKKTIKICSMNVYSVGVAKICLDVNLNIKFDGSLGVSVTINNSNGIEYKNGNIRGINEKKSSVDAELKCDAEFALGFGPALYVIGLKKSLVGLEVRAGLGIVGSVKLHLADDQNHLLDESGCDEATGEEAEMLLKNMTGELKVPSEEVSKIAEGLGKEFTAVGDYVSTRMDSCLDININFVIALSLTDNSFLVDAIGSKVKTTILSVKIPLYHWHIDNWDWSNVSDSCRLTYVPFDGEAAETSETESAEPSDGTVGTGRHLNLSTMNANLSIGGQYQLEITQIPEGYSVSDIVFVSQNEKVASVDQSGKITAIDEGSTIVYAKTSDGKYQTLVAVIVESTSTVKFEGIKI
ncbi:MAG: Ig-like domain-containing protein [Firmicutes bacterium]|nr:Ig-like domain-containing protein [[Eubacterium] siraeum]MCM1487899.1 Ig-like domain-containing protein [Bacillota bacterium]